MNFAKEVERLVDPINVGTLHFIQGFNRLLPKAIQDKLVKSSSKNTPFMGFVVEPYVMGCFEFWFYCGRFINCQKRIGKQSIKNHVSF